MRKSILVGILLILSVTLYSVDIDTSPNSMTIDKHPVSILSDYVGHDPILITSDDDFETQGWPGNGTNVDPYVIEGLSINGMKSNSCIAIFSTSVQFIIRNCLLFNASGINPNTSGVYWDWDNLTMTAGINSILFYNVTNGLIEHNKIVDNWAAGIFLVISHNNTFDSNDCSNNRHGFYLWGSDNNTITNNTIIGGSLTGRTYDSDAGIQLGCWYVFPFVGTYINSEGNVIVGNRFANHTDHNAEESVVTPADTWPYNPNHWDDGISSGNFWDDYYSSLSEVYNITGNADAVDHYPRPIDTVSPTIDTPTDREIQFGINGNSITWNPSDGNPETYSVYREGVLIESDTWNGSSITVDIDGLELGVYNYTLLVSDTCWNTRTDTVIVTVLDTTAPIIDGPDDFQYEYGTTNHIITWAITEFKPHYFEIFRNETQLDSGPWDGSNIQVSVDGLYFGTYNFTLLVSDTSNNSASHTVIVSVADTINPVISSLEDTQFTVGDVDHNLIWTLQDTNPFSYEIVMDSILIASGTWNFTGETVTIALDSLVVGTHFITITITDLAGNEASDVVIVSVLPTATTNTATTSSSTTTTGSPADPQFQFIAALGIGLGLVIFVIIMFKRK